MDASVDKVLAHVEKLPLSDKLNLLEKIIQSLKQDHDSATQRDWNQLYGLGKDVWAGLDAQDYVDEMRADR